MLRRPLESTEHAPVMGAHYGCCRGTRWWRERDGPKGWRCATCHPAPTGIETIEASTDPQATTDREGPQPCR
jgi:hypothetical protein